MEPKIKKLARKFLFFGLVNYLIYPLLFPITSTIFSSFSQDPEKINLESLEDKKGQEYTSFTALDYLNLAKSLAHENSNPEDDCKSRVVATFNVYKQLVEDDGRKELSDNIRFAAGINYEAGHWWLEYREEDKRDWEGYETMNFSKFAKGYSKDFNSFPGKKIFYPTKSSLKKGGIIEILYNVYKR